MKKNGFFVAMLAKAMVIAVLAFGLVVAGCDAVTDAITGTQYTVTYTAGRGGGSTPVSQTVKSGTAINLPGPGSMTAPDGEIFDGWKDGGGTAYAGGAVYTVNANVTFTAQWVANAPTTYTVTYNANGASGTVPTAQTAVSGTSVTIAGHGDLASAGKIFSGWNTESSGTGALHAAGSSLTVTANIALYAQWVTASATTYTVSYNANGASGTAPTAQTATSGTSVYVAGQGELTYAGKAFNGWNTEDADTGTPYAAGSSLIVTANITLYAQWINASATTYTVSYDANGASGTAPTAQTVASGTSVYVAGQGSLIFAEKAFNGWNTEASGTGTSYAAGSSLTVTANIALYAQWITVSPTTYTVTFNADGGTPTPTARTVNSGDPLGTLPTAPAKDGYTFDGWFTLQNGGGTEYSAASTVTGNITLYAKWTAATGTGNITIGIDDEGNDAFSQTTFILKKTGTPIEQTKTITLTGDWDGQTWYVGLNTAGTGTSITLNAPDYTAGSHTLSVTLQKGSGAAAAYWSKTLTFTVEE